jgi:hypothetical protein
MISRCTKFSLHNKLQFLIPRCCKPPTWDHLFLVCFVGGFSTFLYWLMYMPTIWNFLCERKKSLQVNIQMHKLEGFKLYLAPHNWFTHLQASTHWTYVLYQQIQVQGPHVLLQLLHQHRSFQVTSCTWGISSITLDPMGFVLHWKCTLWSCTSRSQAASNKIILQGLCWEENMHRKCTRISIAP